MSVVMRSQRPFAEENGRLQCSTVRSCNCCPYGYHINLDFVRYCEALANIKPSEEQLRRRSRRRLRKSMEVMLGLETLFGQWDAAERVHNVPEAPTESECESLHRERRRKDGVGSAANGNEYRPLPPPQQQQRASSVPRFTYGGLTRTDSPLGGTDGALLLRKAPPETRAFLHDALDEVCSDFERTLERASSKKKKKAVILAVSDGEDDGRGADIASILASDRNNNYMNGGIVYGRKRTCNTWEEYVDALDSCVSGNKSPGPSRSFTRSVTLPLPPSPHKQQQEKAQQYESYVRATVAANAAKSTLERMVPPPPPPRRHALLGQLTVKKSPVLNHLKSPLSDVVASTPTDSTTTTDAQTLFHIRQQMALSLKRMKDLEEQVKTIPELQSEVSQLRDEKQRLQSILQRKEEEQQRVRESSRLSSSPSPVASPKYASPIQFTPQRISPIALESLGARLAGTATPPDRQPRCHAVLKRDVGTMCALHATRDIGVGSPPVAARRSIGTCPLLAVDLREPLYTRDELQRHADEAVRQQSKACTSVGTQMSVTKRDVRDASAQTLAERPVQKYSVGVAAQVATRDNYSMCKADVRSVGCSDDTVKDTRCSKCATPRRTIGSGTDTSTVDGSAPVSLRSLDLPGRSLGGDNVKMLTVGVAAATESSGVVRRKNVGTQWQTGRACSVAIQTLPPPSVHSVGVQTRPEMRHCGAQISPDVATRPTDTRDLVRLSVTQVNATEIAPPSKMATADGGTITKDSAVQTAAAAAVSDTKRTMPAYGVRHAASNTDGVPTCDVACGDIVKPHISIACADNYCDSCKDTIKNLAKDFTKVALSPVASRAADSKIPRPTHLTSPSPIRKKFLRQNTYTIAPTTTTTTTPSPIMERRTPLSTLQEKMSSADVEAKLDGDTVGVTPLRRNLPKPYELSHAGVVEGLDDLIVKEETCVRISWSRDASPAPAKTSPPEEAASPTKSPDNSLSDKMAASAESSDSKSSSPDISTGATRKATPEKSSQSDDTQATDETVVPSDNRIRLQPSRDFYVALRSINDSLRKLPAKGGGGRPASVKAANATVQKEWFRAASLENSTALNVEDYLLAFRDMSVPLLEHCVNMIDVNGNTVIHYAVSHGNFEVVSTLLDSKVCNVNQMNNAGYTCVMLISLAKLKNPAHRTVVQRLFQMADVNVRAKKHGQTALMLAVSHGNLDMVEMLLTAGADLNVQDEDGSTALMCAAEHGRADIVKNLLSQPACDSLVQDVDGSTAFKIAWQAGHRDIGLLLYVHEQMLRSQLPEKQEAGTRTATLMPLSPKRRPSQ